MSARLDRANKLVTTVKTNDPRAMKNIKIVHDSIEHQLKVLLSL